MSECKHENVIPIAYGYPSETMEEMAVRGEIELGGCVSHPDSPDFLCLDCGQRFRDEQRRKKLLNISVSEMTDRQLLNLMLRYDKLARDEQKRNPINDGDTVLVASNMPLMPHAALYRYHLPDDYWSAREEAVKRGLI